MAIKIIRELSDLPSIQPSDDCRMYRYAVGYQDGYIPNYGNECAWSNVGNTIKILSGELVIGGYQLSIDNNGAEITVPSISGNTYYALAMTLDLRVAGSPSAHLELFSSLSSTPDVPQGDDISSNSSGIRRLTLYTFTANYSNFSSIAKKVSAIYSYSDFKSGAVPVGAVQVYNLADAGVPHNVWFTKEQGESGKPAQASQFTYTPQTGTLKAAKMYAEDSLETPGEVIAGHINLTNTNEAILHRTTLAENITWNPFKSGSYSFVPEWLQNINEGDLLEFVISDGGIYRVRVYKDSKSSTRFWLEIHRVGFDNSKWLIRVYLLSYYRPVSGVAELPTASSIGHYFGGGSTADLSTDDFYFTAVYKYTK